MHKQNTCAWKSWFVEPASPSRLSRQFIGGFHKDFLQIVKSDFIEEQLMVLELSEDKKTAGSTEGYENSRFAYPA